MPECTQAMAPFRLWGQKERRRQMRGPRKFSARRLGRLVLWTIVIGAISLVTLIGGLWLGCILQRNKEVVLPRPTGPYGVGRAAFVWTDPTRTETLTADHDAKRKLLVWVWYPAAVTSTARPADYLLPEWRREREQLWGDGKVLMQSPATIHCHAVAAASVSPAQSAYPVLIMEPGLGPIVPDYTTLAEDIASHGYVV